MSETRDPIAAKSSASLMDARSAFLRAAELIQERRHAAELATARSARDADFDIEAYWRARAEGLAQAEAICRANAKELG